MHARLAELGLSHLADAVESAQLTVNGGELRVVTTKEYRLYFNDPALAGAVREVAGSALRLNLTVAAAVEAAPPVAPPVVREDAARDRALSHPEVRRFQEMFPDSRVYKVRNLKE